ncbi:uncharacterized protein LOC133184336 [Saccostrea echinata]|uniref:uncharacterized protein LOC133184336 n=1 Tax=Saccostrea echinata TaxID=191078 RepID=UPI002A7F9A65|nr:uncharacterized protein LOC133184336 [Saccostrea echinata]
MNPEGAAGITLGSTTPHYGCDVLQAINRDLEQRVSIQQEEIDILKQKLLSLEADILIKQHALTKVAMQEQEIQLLKEIVLEKEKWREQANDLSQDNDRLRQVNEDLMIENRRQRQIIGELEENMKLMSTILDLRTTELEQEKKNKLHLKRKLHVLSTAEETPECHGRFKRQSLKDCPRCHAEISSTNLCRYHPKAPVKLDGTYLFPCCGQSGKSEPEGCQSSNHHFMVFGT